MEENEDEDHRELCKYGLNCYQKNYEHHKRFKHPKRKSQETTVNQPKKHKLEEQMKKVPEGGKKDSFSGVESEQLEKVPVEGWRDSASREESSTLQNGVVQDFLELPSDIFSKIELVYLVKMPDDFFSFYEFCKSLDNRNPHSALAAADLKLVGPFDFFDRELKEFTQEDGLRHFRYYYDPPEFQTVLSSNSGKQLHYGYFRDNPKDMPVFVGSNDASSGCNIDIVGSDLFSTLNSHLNKVMKISDPFRKMKLQKIQQTLTNWSTEKGVKLDTYAKTNRERKSKMVSKTFHGAGIVVPYDKKTEVGYRELKENDKDLKKILGELCAAKTEEARQTFWAELQPVITYANIANDECDFGTSLELGIDLFCYGDPLLHKAILNILPTSYDLLGRSEFGTILKAHLKNRVKGTDLNTILK